MKHSRRGRRSRSVSPRDCHLATRGGMKMRSRLGSASSLPTSSARVLSASYRIRKFLRPYVAQALARVSRIICKQTHSYRACNHTPTITAKIMCRLLSMHAAHVSWNLQSNVQHRHAGATLMPVHYLPVYIVQALTRVSKIICCADMNITQSTQLH